MIIYRALLKVAAFGLVTLASTLAVAADGKVFPGTMCRQEGASSSITYDGNGRIQNPTASPVWVVCPIVRDSVTATWSAVTAIVADRNGGADDASNNANVVCRAWTAQVDGLGWYTQKNTLGAYPNWWDFQSLTFATNGANERDWGSYYLECRIPAVYNGLYSGIDSYQIDEN